MSTTRPKLRTVSAYALAHGVNPDTGQPYSLVGFEYLADIFDDLVPRVVIQKGAQVGATVMAMLRRPVVPRQTAKVGHVPVPHAPQCRPLPPGAFYRARPP